MSRSAESLNQLTQKLERARIDLTEDKINLRGVETETYTNPLRAERTAVSEVAGRRVVKVQLDLLGQGRRTRVRRKKSVTIDTFNLQTKYEGDTPVGLVTVHRIVKSFSIETTGRKADRIKRILVFHVFIPREVMCRELKAQFDLR